MVLWKKLWYYAENFGTIYERKKNDRLTKPGKLWFIMEKDMVIYKSSWGFWTNV